MASLKQIFIPVIGAALSLGIANKTLAQDSRPVNSEQPTYAKNDVKPVVANTNNATAVFNDTTKAASIVTENPLDPAIREGGFGDARVHSGKNNLMVVQISGPVLDKLKVEAQNIHDKFKNAAVPTEVVVFYNMNKELSQIMGTIAMNGDKFKLPSGTSAFDAKTLKQYADTFAKYYFKHYGQATASNTNSASGQAVEYQP